MAYYILLVIIVFLLCLIIFIRSRYKLKLQEITLKNEYLSQNLNDLNTQLDSKKNELEKLRNSQKSEILEMQESYEKKISQALQEQEKKLESKEKQKQENLKELLDNERQIQIALLTQKFGELSNVILEEKSKSFEEKQNLSLKPLCEEIARFKQEIEKNTKDSNEKQVELRVQLQNLQDMSVKVSKDATNLANALKGNSKMQGDWGEIILERLLEVSGLQKDREYFTQFNIKNSDENKNLRPDMIVKLPSKRYVIIDSKVSLNAYERYVNNDLNSQDLSAHIESVKTHIKTLQNKEYQNFLSEENLDFVIMFMPIEGAFNEILKKNIDVYLESYKKNVIIASPTTLMVILRLIYNIWSNEAKDKNITKILKECDKLIKKFESFGKNMDKIGSSIQNLQSTFTSAQGQLMDGKGSMKNHLNAISDYMVKIPSEILDKNEGNIEYKLTN